ncbi:MAG: type II toxin-antitoxin system HicB family antitoxin [Nanoarchaeota archaeon]
MEKHKLTIHRYTIVLEPAEEGGYVVTVPYLPGCATQGENFEEAISMAKEAIELYLETLKEHKEEIPVEPEGVVISEVVVNA